MSTLDDIAKERQLIAERLAKLDGDRAKLAEQLAELEAAERVLSRFTQARPRRGRRAATPDAAAPAAPRRGRAGRRKAAPTVAALSLGDATLRAVTAQGGGTSAEDVRQYIADKFGLQVRPNHLGMALQRHRRAGRLDQRDTLWYPHQSTSDIA
jgi:hypothetical protein